MACSVRGCLSPYFILHRILIPLMTQMPLKVWYCKEWPNVKETWRKVVGLWSCQQKPCPRSHSLNMSSWASSMSGTILGTSSPAVVHKGRRYPECVALTVVKAAGEGKAGTRGRKLWAFCGGREGASVESCGQRSPWGRGNTQGEEVASPGEVGAGQ